MFDRIKIKKILEKKGYSSFVVKRIKLLNEKVWCVYSKYLGVCIGNKASDFKKVSVFIPLVHLGKSLVHDKVKVEDYWLGRGWKDPFKEQYEKGIITLEEYEAGLEEIEEPLTESELELVDVLKVADVIYKKNRWVSLYYRIVENKWFKKFAPAFMQKKEIDLSYFSDYRESQSRSKWM